MKTLGVYKPSYDRLIDIYAELMEQYESLTAKYKESEYQYGEPTADGGIKKSPLVSTIENLRKDILQYSDRLCLNPKANQTNEKERPNKEPSGLEAALANLEE